MNIHKTTCPTCGNRVYASLAEIEAKFAERYGDDSRTRDMARAAWISERVEGSKHEILGDAADGNVPRDIASFGELDNHVDMNYYGGLIDGIEEMTDEFFERANAVQRIVDSWIKDGGIEKAEVQPLKNAGNENDDQTIAALIEWAASAWLDPEIRMIDSHTGRIYVVYFRDTSVGEIVVAVDDPDDGSTGEIATFFNDEAPTAISVIEEHMKAARQRRVKASS